MDNYLKRIKGTLNYKLSLSNIELYHSNLLSDVLEKFCDQPFTLLDGVVENYDNFRVTKVQREKKNKDLTINLTDDRRDIMVIIENKFKSIPYREQLVKYMVEDKETYYILLSLTQPAEGVLPEGWVWKNYDALSSYYLTISDSIETNSDSIETKSKLYSEFLKDYADYVESISYLLEIDSLDMNIRDYYLNEDVEKKITEIGLIDLVHKIRYENMKNRIDSSNVTTYSGRISGGYYFGCTYKISDKISFDIQIQGDQYRHKLNVSKSIVKSLSELKEICDKLKTDALLFNYTEGEGAGFFNTANRRKDWNKYESRDSVDLYDYKKIKRETSFDQLISYLNKDLSQLISNADEIKEVVLES
ncbi:PD-(D/E)XK nuclease family protein [Streptococcus pneumoniae]